MATHVMMVSPQYLTRPLLVALCYSIVPTIYGISGRIHISIADQLFCYVVPIQQSSILRVAHIQ